MQARYFLPCLPSVGRFHELCLKGLTYMYGHCLPPGSPYVLVFPRQRSRRNSDGVAFNGFRRFSASISLYLGNDTNMTS